MSYVNQNVKGSFYGDGRAALKRLCDTVEDWEDEASVFSGLRLIVQALHNDEREDQASTGSKVRDIFKQMRNQKNPIELYDYLFGFDFLKMKYDLKIDQKELNELSPGERGGLLLIFYLMLDKQDIPLVIDQPEDMGEGRKVHTAEGLSSKFGSASAKWGGLTAVVEAANNFLGGYAPQTAADVQRLLYDAATNPGSLGASVMIKRCYSSGP